MYKAGVACDGCHTTVQLAGTGAMSFTKKLSGPKQCADCHGNSRYGEMLAAWQEDVRDRLNELSPVMEELEKALRSSPATSEQIAEARKLLDSARTKFSYIANDGSYGAHNFPYVTEVLDSAGEGLEKCRSLVAESNKATGGSY